MNSPILEQTFVPNLYGIIITNADVAFQAIKQSSKSVFNIAGNLKSRLSMLNQQKSEAEALTQKSLSTKLEAEITKEEQLENDMRHVSSILQAGYRKYVSVKTVKAFMQVTPATFMDKIQDFNRPIYTIGEEEGLEGQKLTEALQRKGASELIKKAIATKLFDEILILNLDYPRQEALDKAAEAALIRAEDPIAFGFYNNSPDNLFFIADWVDEKCDLTFEKMIEGIKGNSL